MFKKFIAIRIAVFPVFISTAPFAEEKSPNREIAERLICQIDFSSWDQESLRVTPDSKHVAYVAGIGNKKFVVVDGKEEKQYDTIVRGEVVFDSFNGLHYLAIKANSIYLGKIRSALNTRQTTTRKAFPQRQYL